MPEDDAVQENLICPLTPTFPFLDLSEPITAFPEYQLLPQLFSAPRATNANLSRHFPQRRRLATTDTCIWRGSSGRPRTAEEAVDFECVQHELCGAHGTWPVEAPQGQERELS